MGDVVSAVDRYTDIAPDVRERLKARMVRRNYDDVVSIKRDSITGKSRYGSTIRDMHFGSRQVCHSVSRSAWTAQMQERGLVYCDSGQCILVPTVCRNVSRISRAEVADERAEGEPEFALIAAAPPSAEIGLIPSGGAPPSFESARAFAAPFTPESGAPGALPGGGSFGGPAPPGTFGAPVPGFPLSPPLGAPPLTPDVPAPPLGTPPVTPVPEPETWALMLGGLGALAAWRRKRAR